MADPSSGGGYVWSARLAPSDINLDLFVSNGLRSIPVALQPLNDSKIRLQNARINQENLKGVTAHFKDVTEVKQFGKNGIICRSHNLACVDRHLLERSFTSEDIRLTSGNILSFGGLHRGRCIPSCKEALEVFRMTEGK